ncbi:hypothetical protein CSOJ01_13532 [Colletotrichum sojae]|uniref:Uncharacterized protein n=1 Tax=Colletotrichum sojae TaxID=2175907 RepID=A0A8H6MKF8_9PEZI|nr:hypothetical protein CSOJ01_13532 [Colletotrichum sojae]
MRLTDMTAGGTFLILAKLLTETPPRRAVSPSGIDKPASFLGDLQPPASTQTTQGLAVGELARGYFIVCFWPSKKKPPVKLR